MPRSASTVCHLDGVLDLLSHDHRRFLLADLDGRSPPVALSDLVARTVAWRRGRTGARPDDRRRVAIELHHRHLPQLDDAGFLVYRDDARAVVECPALDLPAGWRSDPSIEPVLAAMGRQ